MAISMDQIKELRERTGAKIVDCKKVLEETGGDMKQALAILREKGLEVLDKKKDRAANEGRTTLRSSVWWGWSSAMRLPGP